MTSNPVAMLRSLIVYAICVPLAIMVGYTLTDVMYDRESLTVIVLLMGFIVFPILMRWHYPLMVFSVAMPVVLFFLPGRPSLFLAMVAISFTISVIERILNRNQHFLSAPSVKWPLLVMLAVVFLTAKLTGGFGMRSMGSDTYGGKKYITLIVGIFTLFALSARAIPKDRANFYMGLYLLGGAFSLITDLYSLFPGELRFIFLLIPPSVNTLDTFSGDQWKVGVARMGGVASAASCVLFWMLARYGFKGSFLTGKIWRPMVIGLMVILIMLGGFRSSILYLLVMLALLFWMEKMYRTGMMLVVVLVGFMGAALMVPMAPHLPRTFQRALAFLPLDISPEAKVDAEASSQWRLEMWNALLPSVPKYLLLGKGYAFSQQTFNEYMGADATFHSHIDASMDPLALSSDFHSGPLSVIIPFGIWGALAWLWFVTAGFWVVWRNYRYGDPELQQYNRFMFASYIAKTIFFFFVFGGMVEDVTGFGSMIGMSIALNHGVRKPKLLSRPVPQQAGRRLDFPARPALQP